MMKIKSQLKTVWAATVLLSLLLSGTAWAAGWSNKTLLKTVEAWGQSGAQTYVQFPAVLINDPGCGSSRYQLAGTAAHVKAMTALASTASLAGRQVEVFFDGTCAGQDGNIIHLIMY